MARGYYADPYLGEYVRKGKSKPPPLIQRGMWTRVAAVRGVVERALHAAQRLQLIVIGCGYDTLVLRLRHDLAHAAGPDRLRCLELDLAPVVHNKARAIRRSALLRSALGIESATEMDAQREAAIFPSTGAVAVTVPGYVLAVADLRSVATVTAALQASGHDSTWPTLWLSECALCYVEATDSAKLLALAAQQSESSAVLIYEMMRPDDAFGRQMLVNLAQRGLALTAIKTYPTLDAQRRRCVDAGYARAEALDLNAVWARSLPPLERSRVMRLEPLDEQEELAMLQAHYCLVLGCNGPAFAHLSLLYTDTPTATATAT